MWAAVVLNVGNEVHFIDGSAEYITVAELEQLAEPIKVYNLEVDDLNTFFVGDDGVLVHNYQDVNEKPVQKHHIATKYRYGEESLKRFSISMVFLFYG